VATASPIPRLLAPGGVRPARVRRTNSTRSPTVQALVRTISNPMGLIGAVIVSLLLIGALAAPLISPFDPIEQHPGSELLRPGGQFLLGTDHLGRDLLSRIIFGSRSSLFVGLVAVGLGASLGIASGLAAGYLGGWADAVIMRAYDALLSFPAILLGIGVVSVLGSGPVSVAYALAFATIPTFARLMRARVLTERERDYVMAAQCIGAGAGRIMRQHVLPNAMAPLLIQISLSMGFAILAESALTFLGLGTQPPMPSWGGMLNESRAYLRTAPTFGIFPGLALALLLLGLNFLSDALRDALDPRRTNA
jgi:ABC-type dipeptide/oligopeptide/nickel transport system permease subunit